VVIAIIAILIGLLVPAVQKVRAAAARIQCGNNLHQLGIAAHNYQSVANQLPPGMDAYGVGELVYLLPYIEQDNQFKLFSFDPSYPIWYRNPLDRPPTTSTDTIPRPPLIYGGEGNFKTLICPAAPDPSQYVTVLMGVDYQTNGTDYPAAGPATPGAHLYSSAPGRLALGRCNYLGMGGYYSANPAAYGCPGCQGFFTYKSNNSLARVPDGTSNTMMFGEFVGGNINWGGSGGIPNGLSGASWVCGFDYTGFAGPSPTGSLNNADGSSNWFTFGSDHPTHQLNVAMGDGSVRHILPSIDFSTWVYLSGISDGVVITYDY